jgi:hypothetical protein
MSTCTNIDFRGARGSNTGDQFHELWALLQVLDILRPENDLKAVGVEGVRTETSDQDEDGPTWDGVDCALYYGGMTLESANRVEFAQLKYSAANPETAWSVARITATTAKKTNNSVIRKMADDFKGAKSRLKQGAGFKIRLISNQDVSTELKKAIETRWSGQLESSGIDQAAIDNLKRLKVATGLTETDFQDFLETLDFSECGEHSRFAVRENVVATVAGLIGNDVSSSVRDLQVRVRELMLPERSKEIVTEQDILLWFGLSGREGLFPCPPDIRIPEQVVQRSGAGEVVRLLTLGERFVLVHGVGGCGKTTLMRQIADRLPEGSVTVYFDCFGGGRYAYSDDKRHLPDNAFLHMANELAVALCLPLFIPRSSKNPATIKSFLAKLRSAGLALTQLAPQGTLLLIVDAADNAVAAASDADPPERPFIYDLFEANLPGLPENVRIVTSCRTARRQLLRLPPHIPEVLCLPFSRQESKQHLETAFSNPSEDLIEQFHHLSNANPRVQAYAIAAAEGDRARLLEALLPGGKSLSDVLKASFNNALIKLGQPKIFEKLVSALAFLPPPISVPSIARIAGCAEDVVSDLALDLTPGLRLHESAVTVADEDFEAFIKNKGATNRAAILADIAADFFATFQTDPYSSIHVADSLIAAGRARDVLSIIDRDPQAAAIGDPIVRRQVQIRRLKLSLAACLDAGSTADALKTVLISAEAEHDDSALNEVLEKELDLSVEFGGASLGRTILLDPDRIEKHGSFLAQDAVRAIRRGDRVTAREQLHFHEAWLRRRRDRVEDEDWSVTDLDVSARVETILELAGPKAALHELMRWTPRHLSIGVASFLAPQLIAAGKTHHLMDILKECPPPGPWDLLVWIPLAMAGEPVEKTAIIKSLKRLRHRFIPDASALGRTYGEENWQKTLLDTFITACELAFKLGVENLVILECVKRLLDALKGKQTCRLYSFEVDRIDGLLRCWLLKEMITGTGSAPKCEAFIAYVKSFDVVPEESKLGKKVKGKKEDKSLQTAQRTNEEDEKLSKKIRALFQVYSGRTNIFSLARHRGVIDSEHLKILGSVASHAYDFDNNHDSSNHRDRAARSVMYLLMVEKIDASELVTQASCLTTGKYGDSFSIHRRKLWNLMRLRTSESNNLVLLIAKAEEDIKKLRASSTEKLEAIICLSRLILPVSRDDAESLFNDAVSIAKEIDEEAIDQIDFVSVVANRARIPERFDRKTIAADIFSFVSGAAERLSGREHFPWWSAVNALTCLDDATALSAICRWADDGTVPLEDTLNPFLLTALKRGIITPEVSTSLSLLVGGPGGELRNELVSRVTADPKRHKEVIEELAKETLLLSPQHERLQLGHVIVDRISQSNVPGGEWLAHLRETIAFLRGITNIPEKTNARRPENAVPPIKDNDVSKKFVFDPQGRSFTTPESIAEVLQEAKSSGLRHDDRKILRTMKDASSSPRERVPFLKALAAVSDESIWSTSRLEMILETVNEWKGTPAVDRWCKDSLPSVLIAQFYAAARWLKEGQSVLHKLLDHTGLDTEGRLQIILAGVAQAGEALTSRSLFAIAEEIARSLDKDEAGMQLRWYSERLRNRLPVEDQYMCPSAEIPSDTAEATARFLFALMSDIDTRVRWRAAHALRQLAKLGGFDIVNATVSQSSRVRDDAFRDSTAPFYFLAAKFWLAISLYRISAETPEALSSCKAQILDMAITAELLHVGIREYAKRTLLQLVSTGTFQLTSSEKKQLDLVNIALKGQTGKGKDHHRSFGMVRDGKRKFKFDELDTIRYWYEDILRIFPTVSQEKVLKIAERWILDKWGADSEANRWDKEPRKGRYNERRFGLWSNSHGSLPTVERYGTHLEWNAMYCVVGELLTTHPISNEEEFHYDRFDYWLGRVLPTDPPEWLSDNRGPTPLEFRLWNDDPRTDKGWLHNIRRDEFMAEIGLHAPPRKGWVVIKGYYTAHFPKREASISVTSALVSPETAPALVRALQTSNGWGSGIPDEDDDDLQIDVQPYSLLGWLAHSEGDRRFDDTDPFRYEVGQIRTKPGRKLTETFGLVPQSGSHRTWIRNDTGEATLLYEAWCDEPSPEEDYYPRRIRSDGWRLWANVDMVRSFLTQEGSDLIYKVQVDRKLRNEYGRSYDTDTKRKTHGKILLLRADGSVFVTKGCVGSWTGAGQGTGG